MSSKARSLTPRLLLLAITTLVLAACTTSTFRADVTRFNQMPGIGSETITIEPESGIDAGIEFVTYADLIGDRLALSGFRPAAGGEPAFTARLGYAITDTGQVDRSGGTSIGIGVGGSGRHVGGAVGTSFDLSGGGKALFERELTLVIIDNGTGRRVFEGRVTSLGATPALANVMPYMIEAMFQGFPGGAGDTMRFEERVEGGGANRY